MRTTSSPRSVSAWCITTSLTWAALFATMKHCRTRAGLLHASGHFACKVCKQWRHKCWGGCVTAVNVRVAKVGGGNVGTRLSVRTRTLDPNENKLGMVAAPPRERYISRGGFKIPNTFPSCCKEWVSLCTGTHARRKKVFSQLYKTCSLGRSLPNPVKANNSTERGVDVLVSYVRGRQDRTPEACIKWNRSGGGGQHANCKCYCDNSSSFSKAPQRD